MNKHGALLTIYCAAFPDLFRFIVGDSRKMA